MISIRPPNTGSFEGFHAKLEECASGGLPQPTSQANLEEGFSGVIPAAHRGTVEIPRGRPLTSLNKGQKQQDQLWYIPFDDCSIVGAI